MNKTWIEWCRNMDHPQDTLPWDHDQWIVWLDYAASHYAEPLSTLSDARSGDWQ